MDEEALINQIAIQEALARLTPEQRDLILLTTRYEVPDGYDGPWPPTLEHIGVYIGIKYYGAPLSEAAIRYRRDKQEAEWRAQRRKSSGNRS